LYVPGLKTFVDEDTGEVVSIERNEVIIESVKQFLENDHIDLIVDSGVKAILLHREDFNTSEYTIIFNTLQKDTANSEKEAVEFIYRQLRNAEPPDEETARGIIDKLFFSDKDMTLVRLGDTGSTRKLNLDISKTLRFLPKKISFQLSNILLSLQMQQN
jgi:DNA-directed RNA polymerase subunit beta